MIKTQLERIRELSSAYVRLTEDHKYILPNGLVMANSVTGIVDMQFRKFDAPAVAARLAKYSDKYNGMSKKDILTEWEEIKNEGGLIHNEIEIELSSGKKTSHLRAKTGIAWVRKNFSGCNLFPEVKVWNEKWSIGGTIDLLAVTSDDQVSMIDWKCGNSEPTYDEKRGFGITPAFKEIVDSKCSKYSAQLSLYWLILAEFGIKPRFLNIVYLGDEGAKKLVVKDYRKQMLRTIYQ